MIAVPLLVESKVRGVLALTRLGTNSFTPAEQRLLEIVAAHVALTLDRARLYNVLRAEAVTDPLTGLYNRRALMERLSSEQARAERGGGELGAIVLDVDGFKRVNDIHGHEAGDVALQEIAQIVRATVRTADTVARWGGEEFAIVLPDATFEAARGVAERLREATAQQPLSAAAGGERLTVSIGLAIFQSPEGELSILSRADQAMYHAKSAGGNRVATLVDGHFILTEEASG
jgi:diguanylate cyclase (GGDEF)-like protein